MKTNRLLLLAASFLMLASITFAQEKTPSQKRDVNRLSEDYYIPARFKGKTILITGAARGIGKYTAIRAVKEGANVVVMDWLPEVGKQTVDSINLMYAKLGGGEAIFVNGSISVDEDCDKMIAETLKKFGKLDYAVLNAGVMDGAYSGVNFEYTPEQRALMPAQITDATNDYWTNVFKTNAEGTFKSLRATLRQMVKQGNGGAIVAVASIAGMTGLAGNPAYVASKHAVNGLIRNAAIDYAPFGIRVNSVNMAETLTPMVERAGDFVKAEIQAGAGFGMGAVKTMSLLKHTDSQKRGSFPWEQASNILYLISDEASALTGTIMATDGGWTNY
ncbi:MAG: SDR family NAD(P)-dependent oxidoreductase [Bacteroidales bacterium]